MPKFQERGRALHRQQREPETHLGGRWEPDWAGLEIAENGT